MCMRVRKVAILGASGLVAQRFQQRLANHPWFELVAVYGSPRTSGRNLGDLDWHLPEPRPTIPKIVVRSLDSLMTDVEDFELVVTGNICEASPGTVTVDFAILVKVPFNRNLGVVAGCGPDIFEFLFTWPTSSIVKLRRWLDIAITVQIVIVNQPSIRG